ncbi:abhydrolase [Dissoconium aciculare CBS 342.82]|uniref:Abhydrolase n=1 Tax=Dissoconium aciculare CBS 342.82 TaxID=1314786 RepID=A0A6J3MCS9_9PEZI|nr:abhydrolase [Dissoconium aciculare CBS 342.82]KAF1824642.1 abhydrolase [Dissoconium aciculare CBS 342.82]
MDLPLHAECRSRYGPLVFICELRFVVLHHTPGESLTPVFRSSSSIMPELDVPGATLHYETQGAGPVLLCISGASGSHEIYKPIARYLKDKFTVVMYDRRGFSQSYLTGAQDYDQRVERDADDAAALIQHLSPDEPATVLANSSGAIVSLKLLQRHEDEIRFLVCHEPPAFSFLPDRDELERTQDGIYQLYRKGGTFPALAEFAKMIDTPEQELPLFMKAFDPRSGPNVFANVQYWFERELPYYPLTKYASRDFQPLRHKLLLANGADTRTHTFQYRANATLAQDLGQELVIVAGAHIGFATHAKQFAVDMVEALKERDGFYETLSG